MFTKSDKKFLKDNFATKDDIKRVLKPVNKSLKNIEKKLDMTIRVFDKDFNYHHRRLTQLEEKVGVKPPPFLTKIN